jgi:uncharacterized protein (TIGR02453 family)
MAMPGTAVFSSQVFTFPRQLKRNNNREWFAKNKARYQECIVEPALSFIGDFAPQLEKISPFFLADARPTRGSLFRIYRDTRFSSDKRPFKTHIGIHFSHASGKDAHAPVFYLHLEPDSCFAAAGIWHPDNQALTKVRTAIVREPEQWAKVRKKLTLEGNSLVRPPRRFDPNHPFIDAEAAGVSLQLSGHTHLGQFVPWSWMAQRIYRQFVYGLSRIGNMQVFTSKALQSPDSTPAAGELPAGS